MLHRPSMRRCRLPAPAELPMMVCTRAGPASRQQHLCCMAWESLQQPLHVRLHQLPAQVQGGSSQSKILHRRDAGNAAKDTTARTWRPHLILLWAHGLEGAIDDAQHGITLLLDLHHLCREGLVPLVQEEHGACLHHAELRSGGEWMPCCSIWSQLPVHARAGQRDLCKGMRPALTLCL